MTVPGETRKGIKSADKMTITGGKFTIDATGAGSKGISVGKHLLINQDDGTTEMLIRAKGSYSEDEETDEETRCMAIKVTKNMAITAGTLKVSNTGTKSRGIKVDGLYYEGPDASVSGDKKKVTPTNTMPPMD